MIQPEDWRGRSARVRTAMQRQHELEVTLLGAMREVSEACGPFGWSPTLEVPEQYIEVSNLIRGAFAEARRDVQRAAEVDTTEAELDAGGLT